MTIYRSCEPVVDTMYGKESGQSLSEAIINTVAAAAGVDPVELPPLFDFIDPDSLNTLFKEHTGAADAENSSVSESRHGTFLCVLMGEYWSVMEPNDHDDADGESGESGPGFGVSGALTGIGGAAYLLKRRLTDNETEPK